MNSFVQEERDSHSASATTAIDYGLTGLRLGLAAGGAGIEKGSAYLPVIFRLRIESGPAPLAYKERFAS